MKKYFVAGLILLLPLSLTLLLVIFLVDFLTQPFLDITTSIIENFQAKGHLLFSHETIRIISRLLILFSLFLFILLLGFIARWFFFRSLIDLTNKLFSKIPFIKGVYKVCKETASALFSRGQRTAFKKSVMVSFPSGTSYGLGFLSGEVPEECQKHSKERLVSVIILTAPHPISGFLMLMPEKNVHAVNMKNEDTIKYIVSCGLIVPEPPKNTP